MSNVLPVGLDFVPYDGALGRQNRLVTDARKCFHECIGDLFGRRGLSITTPISVLRNTERGSKLNDPMKIRVSSTASVLECKLARDEYSPWVSGSSVMECSGLSSYSSLPAANSASRYSTHELCTRATSVAAWELVRMRIRILSSANC